MQLRQGDVAAADGASIVPPPFGSGYPTGVSLYVGWAGLLQSCRPLSGAVIMVVLRIMVKLRGCFNRAAPFRERLCRRVGVHRIPPHRASIVPPPFGSGYPSTTTEFAVVSPFCAFLRKVDPHFRITTSSLCQANPIRKRGALREVPVGPVHHRTSRISRKQRSAVSDRRGRHKIALLPFGHPLTSVHRRDAQGRQLFQPRRIPPELLQPQN